MFSSGGENDEDSDQNWKPPENDLIQKLIAQIEYYFSDENLEKDAFLLKHVRRNKLGYVSVKLLTSFKKVSWFQSASCKPDESTNIRRDVMKVTYLTEAFLQSASLRGWFSVMWWLEVCSQPEL